MNIRPDNMPHNLEAEQGLLGSLLVRPDGLEECADIIRAEHFYSGLHRDIFVRVKEGFERGENLDVRILKDSFKDDKRAENDYIQQLFESCLTTKNNEEYAKYIAALAQRRLLQCIIDEASVVISQDMFAEPNEKIIENIERTIADFQGGALTSQDHTSTATEALRKAYDWIQKVRSGEIVPVKTGFDRLDEHMGGFYGGGLYIIAARPSMGKTALALNMAETAAETGNTLFFSLEMSAEEMAMRMIARRTIISVNDQRKAMALTNEQLKKIAFCKMPENLKIIDRAGMYMADIATICRRQKRKHGLHAVFIDYLGLISGHEDMPKVYQVAEITKQAKNLARDLSVPVILLSQLSRAVETRENKRPMLSDLRDSGAIEQDADVVMFVYREEYYLERELGGDDGFTAHGKDAEKQRQARDRLAQVKGIAEVILGKNRQGNLGTAHLRFRGLQQEFTDV